MDEQKGKWVFSYKNSGLLADRLWIVAAVAGIYIFDKRGPSEFLFCIFGFAFLVAVSSLFKAFGERITLEGEELVRVSCFGAFTARIPLSAVGPDSFTTQAPLFRMTYLLSANGQKIRFGPGISDIGRLLEVILKSAYGVKHSSSDPDPNLALGTYSNNYASALLLGGHYILRQAVRQLELSQTGIQWIDWRGRAKRVAFADLMPGTMTWNWTGGSAVYEIETVKGPLIWDGQMKDSVRLSRFLREVAQQPYLPIPTAALPVYPGARPGVRESAVKVTKA